MTLIGAIPTRAVCRYCGCRHAHHQPDRHDPRIAWCAACTGCCPAQGGPA